LFGIAFGVGLAFIAATTLKPRVRAAGGETASAIAPAVASTDVTAHSAVVPSSDAPKDESAAGVASETAIAPELAHPPPARPTPSASSVPTHRAPIARPAQPRRTPRPASPPSARAPSTAAPEKKQDCSDPFIVDARGIQIPRPECF
jgi:hypothetical protein